MSQKGGLAKNQVLAIAVLVIVVVGVGIGAWYVVTTPPAPRAEPTKIIVGWTEPQTSVALSPLILYDIYYRWIIEDYNATGGLYVPEYGHKIPFGNPIVYDDGGDADTMKTLYQRLITVDHVNLLFAPISTALNYALFPICEQYKMPLIALTFGDDTAGASMKSGTFSYSFSVLGFPAESAEQLMEVFEYINTTVDPGELDSVGVIFDNDQHGIAYGSAIYNALISHGFDHPVYTGYPVTVSPSDFTPMINSLQTAGVDAVVVAGYEGWMFEIQANILDYRPNLIVCGPGMETPIWVHGAWGLTPALTNGTMLYDGWPATAYNTPALEQWAQDHYDRSLLPENIGKIYGGVFGGMWPFPASATFYAGLQCLFEAVQLVGLDGTAIRNALKANNFTTVLGETHLRPGESMQCELAGTINQWQNGTMCEVIWPLSAASKSIVYPMPSGAA